MKDIHPLAELAPRDVVAFSIYQQMKKDKSPNVFLSLEHLNPEKIKSRFSNIYAKLESFGYDMTKDQLPIAPAAHYMVGGVKTGLNGETNIQGLFACGEVASTGVMGANRLASNSLLEGLVFGEVAGRVCLERLAPGTAPGMSNGIDDPNDTARQSARPYKIVSDIRPSDRSELDLQDVRSSLRSVMWRHVGIERDGDQLKDVQDMFDFWARYTMDKIFDDRLGWEVQNLLTIGSLITRSALWRNESRGTHFRLDHPEQQPDYRVHDRWSITQKTPQTVAVGEQAAKP